MRDLLPWLRLIFQRPGRLVMGALLMLLTLASGIALLATSGWFITETALVGLALAAGLAASIDLYTPGGAIRFFALSRTVGRYLERLYNHDTVLRLLTSIRVTLFRHLAGASRPRRAERTGAHWLTRLISDVDALDTLFLRLIAPTVLAGLVALALVILTATLLDTTTALTVALLLALALLIATLATWVRTGTISERQSDREEQLRAAVIEHLEGQAELNAAGREGKHGAWLMRQAYALARQQARVDRRTGWNQALSHLLINLAAVVALWLGFQLYAQGLVSGPVLVLLPIALLGLAESFAALPELFGRLGATIASARRLNRDTAPDPDGTQATPEAPPGAQALVATGLAVRHPGCAPLFTQFKLQLARGERLGIIGHSGSGKSTLADVLVGLLMPCKGRVKRLPVGYLTQRTVLFEDTLRANLLLGNPAASEADCWRVLELVELGERFATEPDRLDCWLGSAGSTLSGGEARRVALARVLLSPAPLIVLDEPFTGVDAATRARIRSRLADWLAGRSLIALAHGPDALPDTDRVLHLTS
ncbi:thiol reductant ABC exporter subunit CydC [Marinobacter sp.]|uniref:thiol reductant ABC exporter subunit CydC n=1 Tax=Marinobacter sp. TaxID=50741 RepID=UPI0035C68759